MGRGLGGDGWAESFRRDADEVGGSRGTRRAWRMQMRGRGPPAGARSGSLAAGNWKALGSFFDWSGPAATAAAAAAAGFPRPSRRARCGTARQPLGPGPASPRPSESADHGQPLGEAGGARARSVGCGSRPLSATPFPPPRARGPPRRGAGQGELPRARESPLWNALMGL